MGRRLSCVDTPADGSHGVLALYDRLGHCEIRGSTTCTTILFGILESTVSRLSPVQLTSAVPESRCCLFRRNVALGLCHHFVSDQELAYCRTPQKRRVEVDVKMTRLDLFVGTFERCLM